MVHVRALGSRRRVVGALSAALLSGTLVACATGAVGGGSGDDGAVAGSLRLPTAGSTSGSTSTPAAATASPRATPSGSPVARPATVAPDVVVVPTRLLIPRIGLSMPIEGVAVATDGRMALPTTGTVAGWYHYSPAPGSRAGASVIAGHVDTRAEGIGPMAGLSALHAGDVVEVESGATRQDYRVQSVQAIRKTTLDLPALFALSGPPRLHLVTCGGAYDQAAHAYEDNVVVIATPVAG